MNDACPRKKGLIFISTCVSALSEDHVENDTISSSPFNTNITVTFP